MLRLCIDSVFCSTLVLTFVSIQALANTAHVEEPTQQVKIGEINFTIPVGYSLKQVSSEKLVKWPVVVDWDGDGNLLVVECGGVAKPIVEHNKLMLHRLIRLIDSDRDGTFDKRVVVADQLPLTQGVLSIGHDILVCSPPEILRLIDEDADGICENREVWFNGQTITGCANDLHGPYMGRDGWIYWCKGAFAEQQHALLDGKQLQTKAAHIFRRRLEGGPIEPVMTGGMDNPVEVAITPEGERFFTSTFLQNPANGLRDGIAHAVYGGVYGKPNGVLEGHLRTGPLMPIMTQLGAAAPSGLICLRSQQLVKPQAANQQAPNQRTLVAALFNLQKVTAHQLQPLGASYTTLDQDLIVADRIDFHPTDILEDSDGSLLVVDTGGWYDLCCPTSRIDQKTASGGIYRLQREASSAVAKNLSDVPQDLLTVEPQQLVTLLHDTRPWVARRVQLAFRQLDSERQGEPVYPIIRHKNTATLIELLGRELSDEKMPQSSRLESLWGLCTLGSDEALAELSKGLFAEDPSIVQAICHAVALYRFKPARAAIEQLVQVGGAAQRRAAAEALGRLGESNSVSALMNALKLESPDRMLEHSVTYALIQLDNAKSISPYASSAYIPRQQQAAMIAIDQLGAAEMLKEDFMLDAACSTDATLAISAAEVLGKHPAWAEQYGEQLSLRIRSLLKDAPPGEPMPAALRTILSGWKDTTAVKQIMNQRISALAKSSLPAQGDTMRLLELYRGGVLEAAWSEPIADWLTDSTYEVLGQLLNLLADMDLSQAPEVKQRILALAKKSTSERERLQFLAALPSGTAAGDESLEQTVLSSLESSDTVNTQSALQALRRLQLTSVGGAQLLARLKEQPPRTLAVAVEAINRLGNDELDQSMLGTLAGMPSARTLSMDQLRNSYRNRSAALRSLADRTVVELSRSPEDVQTKVAATLAKLGPGDPIRGLQLFRSNKAQCAGCHRLGYVGGEIGPELTRIGGSRTREALLEAILFPSARLEQSYQPTKVLTHDGQVYNGLIKRQLGPNSFEMQLTVDKTITLNHDDIERQEPSTVSIMPAGMLELLSVDELSDLLALLESGK